PATGKVCSAHVFAATADGERRTVYFAARVKALPLPMVSFAGAIGPDGTAASIPVGNVPASKELPNRYICIAPVALELAAREEFMKSQAVVTPLRKTGSSESRKELSDR